MLKITKIDNLFQSNHKLTTCVIPTEILHPMIETKIIEEYGDEIQTAWIISVLHTNFNVFIPYTCITSPKGIMYRIEYIKTTESTVYMDGYKQGYAGFHITVNPHLVDTTDHAEWIKGYHKGYVDSKETIPI